LGCDSHVDQVVVDGNRRYDHARSELAFAFRKQADIHQNVPGYSPNAGLGNLRRKRADSRQRIAGNQLRAAGHRIIGMILVLKGESPVGLDTVRQIRIAGCDQDQIPVESAASVDHAGAEDSRVEPVFRAEQRERRALGQQFGGGCGDEELLFIEMIGGLVRIERPELHTEAGMQVFRAAHDRGDALFEGLCAGGGKRDSGNGDKSRDSFHGKLPFYTIGECREYGWDFRRCFLWPVLVQRTRSLQPVWCC